MLYKKNGEAVLSEELFRNPTSEYRGTPFWAWNCKLEKGLLERQIGYFKEMGFGGFHMHSRTGMGTPYLSDEFMEMVRFCVEQAKKNDMLAWLYDEDRFPSGSAGGILTKDPKYRSRHMLFTKRTLETLPPEEAVRTGAPYLIASYEIRLAEDGTLSYYEKREDGAWHAYCLTQEPSPWYNNQTYVDTLNKDAMDAFIRITHERYKEVVGEDFDGAVPAIFTDEPQFERKETLQSALEDGEVKLPWTFDVPETYAAAYGGADITETIPELIWDLPEGRISQARYRFHDHIAERFACAFADNIGAWCRQNKIYLTGHVMEEHNLLAQTHSTGDTMRSYRSFGIPGVDMLCDGLEFSTLKQVQSAVNQYGSEAELSELYGVTNWDFDFRGHKFQGDWQAALGVSVRVPHLAFLSMEGEAKRDYPASIGYQSPWYKEYKYVEDHFARLNTALVRGRPLVRVAVIHPVESYWLHWGPARETAAVRDQIETNFQNITRWLLFANIDFDYICESLLPQQYDAAAGGDARLHVGKMAYRTVIVPACETLRSSTVRALEEFRACGGRLIFLGACPSHIDALPDTEGRIRTLYDISCAMPFEKEAIICALYDDRDIEVEGAENMLYRMRCDGKDKWLFLTHGLKPADKDQPCRQDITVAVRGLYAPLLYDTQDGSILELPYEIDETAKITKIRAVLYDYDSLLLRLRPFGEGSGPRKGVYDKWQSSRGVKRSLPLPQHVTCSFSEPNVLLLDVCAYAFDGGAWQPEEEILRIDNKFREMLGWPCRQGYYAQPWTVPEERPEHTLKLRFSFESTAEIKDALLAAEHAGTLRASLNGIPIKPEIQGYFTDEAIQTLRLPEIRIGTNVLEAELPFGKRIGAEWFYILGKFDVSLSGTKKTLTPCASRRSFESLTRQGMPFYGANATYEAEFILEEPSDISVSLSKYRGALVKVSIDGIVRGIIAYSPYRLNIDALPAGKHTVSLELFGNRYNSFGSLHNADANTWWIDAMVWRTEGDRWTYDYLVRDFGILAPPELKILE